MAETPTAGLPLFFKRIVGVDPKLHGDLRLDRSAGYRFAAGAQFVPLGLEEFETAAQYYPILFTANAPPVAIALLGLEHGQNLFVQSDGSWTPDTYIPAYVRTFPFVFLANDTTSDLYLGMEPDAACLGADRGEQLFEDDEPSRTLNEAIALTVALRNNLLASEQLARTLDQAGLLASEEAKIDFVAGGSAIVRGFKVIKRDRLKTVNDDTFLDWRRRDWLAAIDAHVFSAGRWTRLMDAAAKMRPHAAHSSPLPHAGEL